MHVRLFVLFYMYVHVQDHVQADVSVEMDIDYSGIAGEAEKNKPNLLKFLNSSRVRDVYKSQYFKLLTKLIGSSLPSPNKDPQEFWATLFNTINATPYACRARVQSTRRIVSGRNTSIEAVPWQVSLREKNFPICGGSVITDLWLLTAAHCLIRARASDLSVRLGSSWKTFGGEMYDVRESFVHPQYVSKTKINDVGMVRLYSPLRFSARVMPIRIIGREKKLPSKQAAIVSGWGKLKEGGASATVLQSATMVTISMKLCKRSGLERNAIHAASMFCAGSFSQNTPDACQGDSGGPIVSEGVLIGVVSWGLGCARGNFPGVYARLAYPVIWDWIMDHLNSPAHPDKPEPN